MPAASAPLQVASGLLPCISVLGSCPSIRAGAGHQRPQRPWTPSPFSQLSWLKLAEYPTWPGVPLQGNPPPAPASPILRLVPEALTLTLGLHLAEDETVRASLINEHEFEQMPEDEEDRKTGVLQSTEFAESDTNKLLEQHEATG